MERSKRKKTATKELDQLAAAIHDIDQSVARLRKLLHKSIQAETQADECAEDEYLTPPKTLH